MCSERERNALQRRLRSTSTHCADIYVEQGHFGCTEQCHKLCECGPKMDMQAAGIKNAGNNSNNSLMNVKRVQWSFSELYERKPNPKFVCKCKALLATLLLV